VVQNLVDLERHSLTRPHVGDFTEPAICATSEWSATAFNCGPLLRMSSMREWLTFDGWVGYLAHG
jgi:hypothetical protein